VANYKVTVTEDVTSVSVDETSAVIAVTEQEVTIAPQVTGLQGATGVVQGIAPITYDLQTASVGLNVGSNLETSANFLKVTDDLTAIDSIAFDTAAGETSAVGKIVWNDTDGTLEFGLKGGNVTLQIGQEQVVRVRNNTGATLLNGSAVYITSATSGQINVTLASNDTEANSSKTLGILTEDIPNGQQGFCTTQGLVRGLNTSALTEGATIWLGTNGGLTTTRPSAPANSVAMGVCVSQSGGEATNGIIFVRVINGFELEELHDVLISSPADNEVLTYEASSGLWKNKSNPADGVTSITAESPLTGGTITSTGTIGLDQTALSISPSQVSGTAVITTDSRLSDARTPTAHASSHAAGGSDEVTLAQSQVTNLTTDLAGKAALTASQTFTGAQTLVSSSAAIVPLTVQGASGQTSAVFEAQTSTGSLLARVTSAGTINFVTNLTSTSNNIILSDSAGQVFRGVRANAYTSAISSRFFQVGASGDSVVFTTLNGNTATRAMINANFTTITSFGFDTAPALDGVLNVVSSVTTRVGQIIRGAASQTANLQEWQNSAGSVLARVGSDGQNYAPGHRHPNGYYFLLTDGSGGYLRMLRSSSGPGNPGANSGSIYFRDGTTAGTLKLVVRAGASGAETTILDNIPQT